MRPSFSQNGEDVLLWRCFGHKPQGYYVDVGASAPTTHSVTQLFYEAGWSGLNVDPLAERVAELERARPRDKTVCAAVGRDDREVRLTRTEGFGGLSAVSSAGRLSAEIRENSWSIVTRQTTLTALLETWGVSEIDFLKIDVEGAEVDVLAGLDFSRWRPVVLVIEAAECLVATPADEGCAALLLDAGYRHLFFDGLNQYWGRSEDLPWLTSHFSVGLNVLDGFTPYASGGHPLVNPAHIDHVFARHLALVMFRALGVESHERWEAVMCFDQSPKVLDGPLAPRAVYHLYQRVLARSPEPTELEHALANAGLTGRELIRNLLRSNEFGNLRARLALHDV